MIGVNPDVPAGLARRRCHSDVVWSRFVGGDASDVGCVPDAPSPAVGVTRDAVSDDTTSQVPPDASDHDLMRLAGRGQREALGVLVRRHQERVLALAYRFLGSWDAAEDICQDAFIRVWESAARYDPVAEFTTWLYRIVANLCWDRRRRATREPGALPDDAARLCVVVEDEAPTEQAERRERIRRAVAQLPDRQRLVLILHRYDGLPHRRIVEITGWSTGAIESCLVRAYDRLRELLADLKHD